MRIAVIAIWAGLVFSLIGCGGDGGTDATCEPWCRVVEECTTDTFSECMQACANELSQAGSISSDCANAVRDQNRCLGELDCAGFESWATEVPPDSFPCKSEDEGVIAACF